MSRGFLMIVLAICGVGYMRAEQPALWNSWMKQLGAGRAFDASLTSKTATTGIFDDFVQSQSVEQSVAQPAQPTAKETKLMAELNAETPEFSPMEQAILDKQGDVSSDTLAEYDAKVVNYERKIASTPYTSNDANFRANVITLRKDELMMRCAPGPYGQYLFLAEEMLKDPFPGVADVAKEALQPVDLKFTSVDGRPIDAAQMHGKVVLVDRWVSWCVPCRAAVPDLEEAYGRYHSQGLEIVGMSDDQDKGMLISYVNSQNMPWPQFATWFAKPDDSYSHVFDDAGHPTLFLFDRHGRLLNIVPEERLLQQVATAIAQP